MGDPGVPGWFIGIAVVAILIGVVTTAIRVSTARRIAKDAGLDPDAATVATVFGKDGLDATLVASGLRQAGAPQPRAPEPRSAEDRLRDLQHLHETGLITAEEFDRRRAAILDEV